MKTRQTTIPTEPGAVTTISPPPTPPLAHVPESSLGDGSAIMGAYLELPAVPSTGGLDANDITGAHQPPPALSTTTTPQEGAGDPQSTEAATSLTPPLTPLPSKPTVSPSLTPLHNVCFATQPPEWHTRQVQCAPNETPIDAPTICRRDITCSVVVDMQEQLDSSKEAPGLVGSQRAKMYTLQLPVAKT